VTVTAATLPARPTGFRVWLLAARPATLPAAVVPVIVGTAAAREFHLGPFLGALLASLLIQIGTNLANDVFDFLRGADTQERLGPPRVTQTGLATPSQVKRATYLTFGLAALIGVYLIFVGGWPILLIGVLSILAGLLYTGGPWPYAYHALGDVLCFIFFGLLAVIGSAYLQSLSITALAIWAAIPTGCLVTDILVVNNLRDIATDLKTGKRTLAVVLGERGTRIEYLVLLLMAYAVPLVLWLTGLTTTWFWLLPYLSLPLAIWLVRYVFRTTGKPLNIALKRTGQLHLLFGLLFAASLWLG
jgi:1,4-dihydroxy-2-naphthoate octaprenyltransferase